MNILRFAVLIIFLFVTVLIPIQANEKIDLSKVQSLTVKTLPQGKVNFYQVLGQDFNEILTNPSDETKNFISEKYKRSVAYAPYFDPHTVWYSNAWEYEDLYAIYNCSANACDEYWIDRWNFIVSEHPEWILHGLDQFGEQVPLYIPFVPNDCKAVHCLQLVADIGNPEFRAYWIAELKTLVDDAKQGDQKGYRGLFIDDVNLDLNRAVKRVIADELMLTAPGIDPKINFADGNPIDPRTGDVMEANDWRNYMADFLEEIRAAFPKPEYEIALNQVWFQSKTDDKAWLRAVNVADIINFERGVVDNFSAGSGTFGIDAFWEMHDVVHEKGKRISDYIKPGPDQFETGLSGWLMISAGRDYFGSLKGANPNDWWHGFDINIGYALEERQYDKSNGVYQRAFEHGLVLFREPKQLTTPVTDSYTDYLTAQPTETVTVNFTEPYLTLDGEIVWSVDLEASSGVVLRRVLASESFTSQL